MRQFSQASLDLTANAESCTLKTFCVKSSLFFPPSSKIPGFSPASSMKIPPVTHLTTSALTSTSLWSCAWCWRSAGASGGPGRPKWRAWTEAQTAPDTSRRRTGREPGPDPLRQTGDTELKSFQVLQRQQWIVVHLENVTEEQQQEINSCTLTWFNVIRCCEWTAAKLLITN